MYNNPYQRDDNDNQSNSAYGGYNQGNQFRPNGNGQQPFGFKPPVPRGPKPGIGNNEPSRHGPPLPKRDRARNDLPYGAKPTPFAGGPPRPFGNNPAQESTSYESKSSFVKNNIATFEKKNTANNSSFNRPPQQNNNSFNRPPQNLNGGIRNGQGTGFTNRLSFNPFKFRYQSNNNMEQQQRNRVPMSSRYTLQNLRGISSTFVVKAKQDRKKTLIILLIASTLISISLGIGIAGALGAFDSNKTIVTPPSIGTEAPTMEKLDFIPIDFLNRYNIDTANSLRITDEFQNKLMFINAGFFKVECKSSACSVLDTYSPTEIPQKSTYEYRPGNNKKSVNFKVPTSDSNILCPVDHYIIGIGRQQPFAGGLDYEFSCGAMSNNFVWEKEPTIATEACTASQVAVGIKAESFKIKVYCGDIGFYRQP